MPALKQVERSATLAFCPHAGLLAAGTVAGAIDMSFSTSSVLEVFAVDFASPSESLTLVGTFQAPERFNRLAWGPRTAAASHPHGILAGGLADGSVVLWDPAAILDPKAKADSKPALLAKMQKHTGAVKGLEFNSFSPNLLASGAADSDLCIWDVSKPAAPSMYPPLKGSAAGPGSEITHIAWNRKVQHILASTIANGSTVVWDLKRQKPVISFKDPNSQRRASILQWNPEVATQLVVASDDDRSPTLQMWDLRNSNSPLKEFVGHTKGVLGMAWSPHDPSLLLSSAKDARTLCWDVASAAGEIVCELPAANPSNWAFDVAWYPGAPGVFATASYDGHIALNNLTACTLGKMKETVNADFSVSYEPEGEPVPLRKAPTWMRRSSGVSFGFGGRLVSFSNLKAQATDASGQVQSRTQGQVSVSQLNTEHDLIVRSEAFEAAIAGGDRPALVAFCESKVTAAKETPAAAGASSEEAETWSFLSLLFENDARRELLRRLGFADIMTAESGADGQGNDAGDGQAGAGDLDGVTGGVEGMGLSPNAGNQGRDAEDFFAQHDEDFFDKLPDQDHSIPVPTTPPRRTGGSTAASPGGHAHEDGHGPDSMPDSEHEEDIQRALIAGNYELAVENCFKANRLADALLIANIFNSDLYKRTMHRFMKRHPRPYMQIVRANVDQDWATLVRTRPVGQWRETLALLATYTAQEDWTTLCDILAARLSAAAMHHPASLCYICAGNLDQAVSYWTKGTSAASKEAMQAVIEKSVVFGLATGTKKGSTSLSELVTTYASLLASQGRLTSALEYLEYVPGEASTTVAVLKDRIFRSGAPLPAGSNAPPFPFILEEVRPVTATPSPAAQDTSAHHNGHWTQQQLQHHAPAPSTYTPAAPAPTAYQSYNQPSAPAPTFPGYTQPTASTQPLYGQPTHAAPQYSTYTPQPITQPSYPSYAQQDTQQGGGYMGYGQQQTAAAAPAPVYGAPKKTVPQQPSAPAPMAMGYGGGAASGGGYAPPATGAGSYSTAPAPGGYPPTAGSYPAAPSTGGYPGTAPAAGGYGSSVSMPMVPAVPQHTAPAPAPIANTRPSFVTTNTAAEVAPAYTPAAPTAPPPGPTTYAPPSTSGLGAAPPSQSPKAAAPPAASGPPPTTTIATVDTSAVPADQRSIVTSLTALFNSCVPLANTPMKKKEMDDTTRKVGQLFWRLNAGQVSAGVLPKLVQLCAAIDAGDLPTANHMQVQMTTTDWDECGFWLSAVKRLIKMRTQP